MGGHTSTPLPHTRTLSEGPDETPPTTLEPSPNSGLPPTPAAEHTPGQPREEETTPHTELIFLTHNTPKMGNITSSLTGMGTMIDLHTPDFLLLTETPMLPHHGALTQVIHNRGYKIHYHQGNAPSP